MKRILRLSNGQIAVLYAGVMAVLLGAVAMGTDVGVMYYQWMALQKGIDSAALAGVQLLPQPNGPTLAATTVKSYANNNGVTNSEVTGITCIDPTLGSYSCSNTASQPAGFTPTKVHVDATRVQPYYFARALGLTNVTLKVSSTAFLPPAPSCLNCCAVNCNSSSPPGSPGPSPSPNNVPVSGSGNACGTGTGEYNIIPIAVDNRTKGVWVQGHTYTLNRVTPGGNGNGAWPDAPGNWGNVTLCEGNGNGGAGLRTAIADGFGGSMSVGQTLQTEPGAKVGPVNQGFTDLLAASTDNPTSWTRKDPRMVVVPLVDFSGCTGQCSVRITGFMSFYLDSYVNGGAVHGTFVEYLPDKSINNPQYPAADAGLVGEGVLIN